MQTRGKALLKALPPTPPFVREKLGDRTNLPSRDLGLLNPSISPACLAVGGGCVDMRVCENVYFGVRASVLCVCVCMCVFLCVCVCACVCVCVRGVDRLSVERL